MIGLLCHFTKTKQNQNRKVYQTEMQWTNSILCGNHKTMKPVLPEKEKTSRINKGVETGIKEG